MTGFFLSYETIVELLIINNDFLLIGPQLTHHHSKVISNLNGKEILSNNGTRVFIVGLSLRGAGQNGTATK